MVEVLLYVLIVQVSNPRTIEKILGENMPKTPCPKNIPENLAQCLLRPSGAIAPGHQSVPQPLPYRWIGHNPDCGEES